MKKSVWLYLSLLDRRIVGATSADAVGSTDVIAPAAVEGVEEALQGLTVRHHPRWRRSCIPYRPVSDHVAWSSSSVDLREKLIYPKPSSARRGCRRTRDGGVASFAVRMAARRRK